MIHVVNFWVDLFAQYVAFAIFNVFTFKLKLSIIDFLLERLNFILTRNLPEIKVTFS